MNRRYEARRIGTLSVSRGDEPATAPGIDRALNALNWLHVRQVQGVS